jgi:hypothetical protein
MNEKINEALEKKAENARELGLNYEPQRTWVGLTDEEITTTSKETHFEPKPVAAFARAIEAKLKEKNT